MDNKKRLGYCFVADMRWAMNEYWIWKNKGVYEQNLLYEGIYKKQQKLQAKLKITQVKNGFVFSTSSSHRPFLWFKEYFPRLTYKNT